MMSDLYRVQQLIDLRNLASHGPERRTLAGRIFDLLPDGYAVDIDDEPPHDWTLVGPSDQFRVRELVQL